MLTERLYAARIRYPDPAIKVNDTVKIDLATGKITGFIRFDTAVIAMVTGGRNMGRVGVITSRERHDGGFNIVHIKDAVDNTFATRESNVFVIGNEKPWISLPKGKGVKVSSSLCTHHGHKIDVLPLALDCRGERSSPGLCYCWTLSYPRYINRLAQRNASGTGTESSATCQAGWDWAARTKDTPMKAFSHHRGLCKIMRTRFNKGLGASVIDQTHNCNHERTPATSRRVYNAFLALRTTRSFPNAPERYRTLVSSKKAVAPMFPHAN